jgi:hypothetical protein
MKRAGLPEPEVLAVDGDDRVLRLVPPTISRRSLPPALRDGAGTEDYALQVNQAQVIIAANATAGLLYGADLLGGFLGGLFGGILLLPILGLRESCFVMGLIKLSSLALFLIFIKRKYINEAFKDLIEGMYKE